MFITVHATAAAIIGKHIKTPALAFLLGFISHLILDVIPHGDQHLGKKLFDWKFQEERLTKKNFAGLAVYGIVDYIVTILMIMYVFKNLPLENESSVAWAIIGGVIPDVIVGLYMVGNFKWLRGLFKAHMFNHHLILKKMKNDIPLWIGMVMQIILFIGGFMVLKTW